MSDADKYSSDSYDVHDEPVASTSEDEDTSDFEDQAIEEQTKQSLPDLQSDHLSTVPDSMMTTMDSETKPTKRVTGDTKTTKKARHDPLFIQRIIDADLREKIPIDAFKQDKIVTMIKNTVGIKCKQCGSDNVYVESRQVRSADEAMTKFYTCLNCGNKWRFD